MQSSEVGVELDGDAVAGAQRLEHPVAELEAAIGDGQVAGVGREQLAIDPDGHATSSPPMAPSGPAALATVSSHSAAGSLR